MTSQQTSGTKPTRRTLVKGAAWSVPVVAMAQPAMAVVCSPGNNSPECKPVVTVSGNACKHPGGGTDKYYHFTFCFSNQTAETLTITLTTMVINAITADAFITAGDDMLELVPGENYCVDVDGGPYGDSANGSGQLNYTYQGTTLSGSGFVPVTADDGFSPCQSLPAEGQPMKDSPHDKHCHDPLTNAVVPCPAGV